MSRILDHPRWFAWIVLGVTALLLLAAVLLLLLTLSPRFARWSHRNVVADPRGPDSSIVEAWMP